MYRGRFAPSPTGPLHAGSLVAALASWLDAQAHGGQWLVRIEDVDTPRCVSGAAEIILSQLAGCGLLPDEAPVYQSKRTAGYEQALERLRLRRAAYTCTCSRKDIEQHWLRLGLTKARHAEWPYPGTCQDAAHSQHVGAWRLRSGTPETPLAVSWTDRRLGPQTQDVSTAIGDFVLKRADALWAYQMAVVMDDAAQGITHVVRGEDLADNTPRQIHLQQQLSLPTPIYLHTPLVLDGRGEKLSKSAEAAPFVSGVDAVREALRVLGLSPQPSTLNDILAAAVGEWRDQLARRLDAAAGVSPSPGSPEGAPPQPLGRAGER
jgi:glutamyl-Q tRNA(Asp) synthetase